MKFPPSTTNLIKPIPQKLVFVITDLSIGGAQMMLYKLLSLLDRERFEPVVVSLMDRGTLGDRLEVLGIPVYSIGMVQGKPTPAKIWHFLSTLRQLKPRIIQGWMYHGNLAAQIASFFVPQPVFVFWSVRQSLYSLSYEKTATAAIIQLGAKLSPLPQKIIYNSRISANQHENLGYQFQKTLIIPNGFETDKFSPSPKAKCHLCSELNLPSHAFLIGLIGRYDPIKDHGNFLQAAAILLNELSQIHILPIHFILVGEGVDINNQSLYELVKNLKLTEQVHLLGERHDIAQITAALDIATSTSFGEGFANVIGEAMSCGVPCVVTDVGDSAWVVADTGRVVPPRNSKALATAWKELIDLDYEGRNALGKAARSRIINSFSLDSVVSQYESLYASVLSGNI